MQPLQTQTALSPAGAEQVGLFIWEELICCRSIIFPPKPCAARCLDHFSLSTSFRGICLINGEHQYAGFGCSTHTHTCTEGGEGLSAPIPQPGFRQPKSPAPRRKGNDGDHPLLAQVFPTGGGPCPHRSPRRIRSSLRKGLCLQLQPRREKFANASSPEVAMGHGGGKITPPGGGKPLPGVARSCDAGAPSFGEKS